MDKAATGCYSAYHRTQQPQAKAGNRVMEAPGGRPAPSARRPERENHMTKMLLCGQCGDTYSLSVMKDLESPRCCACSTSAGFFLPDGHHALLLGPAIALSLDRRQAIERRPGEYYPVRLMRIPDGDRIILVSATPSEAVIRTPCTRCPTLPEKQCKYKVTAIVTPSDEQGKVRVTVQVEAAGEQPRTAHINLLPESGTAEDLDSRFLQGGRG
jgi:hypothetical protein